MPPCGHLVWPGVSLITLLLLCKRKTLPLNLQHPQTSKPSFPILPLLLQAVKCSLILLPLSLHAYQNYSPSYYVCMCVSSVCCCVFSCSCVAGWECCVPKLRFWNTAILWYCVDTGHIKNEWADYCGIYQAHLLPRGWPPSILNIQWDFPLLHPLSWAVFMLVSSHSKADWVILLNTLGKSQHFLWWEQQMIHGYLEYFQRW